MLPLPFYFYLFDHPRRNSRGHCVCGDIPGHRCTCRDNRVFIDRYARRNGGAGTALHPVTPGIRNVTANRIVNDFLMFLFLSCHIICLACSAMFFSSVLL